MSGADDERSTYVVTQGPIVVPGNQCLRSVKIEIGEIDKRDLPPEQRAILLRLSTNKRMRKVWSELTRRNRSRRGFVNQARRSDKSRSQHGVQSDALREIFHFSFCAARDKPAVSKPGDVEREKKTSGSKLRCYETSRRRLRFRTSQLNG